MLKSQIVTIIMFTALIAFLTTIAVQNQIRAPERTQERRERPQEETPEEIIARLQFETAALELETAKTNQKTARIEKRANKKGE